jgi:hypothetical protein
MKNKETKKFSLGEIHRKGLLISSGGEPYRDRATITSVLRGKPFTVENTRYGEAKMYDQSVIDELNKRWD